jgi:hypothetical protein
MKTWVKNLVDCTFKYKCAGDWKVGKGKKLALPRTEDLLKRDHCTRLTGKDLLGTYDAKLLNVSL